MDRVQDLLARHRRIGPCRQKGQQVRLEGRQAGFVGALLQVAVGGVKDHLAQRPGHGPRCGRRPHGLALQHQLEPQQQLAGLEGLDHIVQRAQLKANDTVAGLASRAEDHDGEMVLGPPDAQQMEPRFALAQVHVHDGGIGGMPLDRAQGLLKVASALDLVAVAAQHPFEQTLQQWIVVNDEHCLGHGYAKKLII